MANEQVLFNYRPTRTESNTLLHVVSKINYKCSSSPLRKHFHRQQQQNGIRFAVGGDEEGGS